MRTLTSLASLLLLLAAAEAMADRSLAPGGMELEPSHDYVLQGDRDVLINDGSFEAGSCAGGSPWLCSSDNECDWITDLVPLGLYNYDGNHVAWLGGYCNELPTIQTEILQPVLIEQPILTWYWLAYVNLGGNLVTVTVDGIQVYSHITDFADHLLGYQQAQADVSAFVGGVHQISFNYQLAQEVGDNYFVDFVGYPGGGPPNVQFGFEQLDFTYEDVALEPAQDTDVLRCTMFFNPGSEPFFANLAVRLSPDQNELWAVRNVTLPTASQAPPEEMISVCFPLESLGVPPEGAPVTELEFGFTLTPDPLIDPDVPIWIQNLQWQPTTVANNVVDAHGNEQAAPIEPVDNLLFSWWEPFDLSGIWEIHTWIGCNMPNQPLDSTTVAHDWNGCGPAAHANSMLWLEGEHDEIDFPPNLRQTFEQLSHLMNRLHKQGATPHEQIIGKLDFIEAYDLPIVVKYQNRYDEGNISSSTGLSSAEDKDGGENEWPTWDWLKSESEHGEDVELGVGYYYTYDGAVHRDGGHVVVLTGTETVLGNERVTYKHDRRQQDGTGTAQESSGLITVGGITAIPGLNGWSRPGPGLPLVRNTAVLEDVISESYDPDHVSAPSSHTYSAYCQSFKRTIAPGQKISITYPNDPTRCCNATVYRLDRTVKPPKWVKVNVWNFNSGKTRVWVNNTGFPVTIMVHNDDHKTDGGEYVPFTVELSVESAEAGDETTASNEFEYGGYSMGGSGDGSIEFGNQDGPSIDIDCSLGVELSDFPAGMSPGAVSNLNMVHPIPAWNPYWVSLSLELNIESVNMPGDLEIFCPTNGVFTTLFVSEPGLYTVDLGDMPETELFELSLTIPPEEGPVPSLLDFTFECLGVPSGVPVDGTGVEDDAPAAFVTLDQNVPNPFNPKTSIRFSLPEAGTVDLSVYDVAGRRVTTLVAGRLEAGAHTVEWNGRNAAGESVATGLYFYRLVTEGETLTRKMLMMK